SLNVYRPIKRPVVIGLEFVPLITNRLWRSLAQQEKRLLQLNWREPLRARSINGKQHPMRSIHGYTSLPRGNTAQGAQEKYTIPTPCYRLDGQIIPQSAWQRSRSWGGDGSAARPARSRSAWTAQHPIGTTRSGESSKSEDSLRSCFGWLAEAGLEETRN